MRNHRTLVLIAMAALATGCRTTVSTSPPSTPNAVVTRTVAIRAWEVWNASVCLGSIVRYEDPADPVRAFYAVRNTEQQDLGVVDLEGRAWRYMAHEHDPVWLGTGTVVQGAARILGGDETCSLREVAVESLSRPLDPAPTLPH